MASDGIRAGSLFWDLDIADQEKVLRKVDELGRKLDEVLNKRRTPPGGGGPLDGVAEEADRAKNRLSEFQAEFTRLTAQFRLGQTSASQYGSSLSNLQSRIRQTAQATDLTNAEYTTLNSLLPRVERAHATLGGTTAEVTAKSRALAAEVHKLRNNWQDTGQATEATKQRLSELVVEIREYAQELREADGGTTRFIPNLRMLDSAARSGTATIDGMEGRISRLGLASQMNLGVLNALQAELGRFGPVGQAAGRGLGIVAGGFNTMGTGAMLASGGVVALAATAAALTHRGIPEVKEMQSALRVLVASGENLSQAQLDQTLRRIQESAGAAGTQFRRAEIATALAEIVKAGVDMADAMHLLEPGMHLANVTGQELNETTLLLLGNLRQFGLDTTEAARVADALAEADLAAAEGARELSEGLAIVGPVAAAAGLEFEDVLGILVELDNKGMSAANVGATALRGAFSALLDPTEKARGVLAELGVELTDGTGKRRPLLDVLHDLRDTLEGNEEAAAIAAQVFDTRAITAVVNMTEKSEELANQLRNSDGALRAYSETMTQDNLQKAQESFSNAISDLALTFAGTFASDIAAATTALAGWIRVVDSWLGRFDEDRLVTQYEADYGVTFAPNARERVRAVLNELSRLDEEARQLQEAIDARANVPGWAGAGLEQMQRRLDANREAAAALRQELIDMQREFMLDGSADGGGGAGAEGEGGGSAIGRALAEDIATARELKAALDEATKSGDPEAWLKASRAVDEFRQSSDQAAQAWQAVLATLSGKGAKPERTVDAIFEDLEKAGTIAERAAAAAGNTLEAQLQSLETRTRAVNGAIAELMARPDVNQGDNPDRLAYLLNRSEELEDSIARVKRQITTLAAGTGAVAGLRPGDTSIAGVTIPGAPTDPAEEAARLRAVENWRKVQAAVEAYGQALADVETRLNFGLVDAEGAVNERLNATQRLLQALVPLYSTLTDEQLAYVQGIIGDSQHLRRELEALERDANRERARRAHAARMQAEDERPSITGMFKTPAELVAWAKEQRAAAQELEHSIREAATQRGASILQGYRDSAALRLEARALGREITTAITDGSLEGLRKLEERLLTTLKELGDDPSAAPFIGLLTQVRAGIQAVTAEVEAEARALEERQRRNVANVMRIELERQYQDLGRRSVAAMRAGSIDALRALEREVLDLLNELGDDPSAAPLMGLLTNLRAEIQNLTTSADQASLEGLQRRIIALRNLGAEPTSEAVKELVRQINELQLRAALEELREKGAKNLSAFAREVLRLNGVMMAGNQDLLTFSQTLRSIGAGAIGDGLADIVDGIEKIAAAGGDAEVAVEGLSLALQGATRLVEAFGEGDGIAAVRDLAVLLGEGIGRLFKVEGGGSLVGGLFDFVGAIWQGISDLFTGDSPAARAIRDGLAPAVQSAFTQGILAALRDEENWRENLESNVRMAFLAGLIDAFVKTAIIQAVMAPIFVEYSKMVARGQWDAAAEFLANSLPAAIERGMQQVDSFLSSLPPGLIPTVPKPPDPTGGGGDPFQGPTGVFELPTAAVTGIAAPEWARDLVNAGRLQLEAAANFAQAVELLRSEGITVRTESSSDGGGAAPATARAV